MLVAGEWRFTPLLNGSKSEKGRLPSGARRIPAAGDVRYDTYTLLPPATALVNGQHTALAKRVAEFVSWAARHARVRHLAAAASPGSRLRVTGRTTRDRLRSSPANATRKAGSRSADSCCNSVRDRSDRRESCDDICGFHDTCGSCGTALPRRRVQRRLHWAPSEATM